MFNNTSKEKIANYFESWKKVLRDKELTAIQKVILKDLELYRNTRTGYAWPSTTKIGEDLGVNRKTIERNLKRLEDSKLVEVKRQKGGLNKYLLARNLTYPLHEIEANLGHQSPYFEKSSCLDVTENEKLGQNRTQPGTFETPTRDTSVPITIPRTTSNNYIGKSELLRGDGDTKGNTTVEDKSNAGTVPPPTAEPPEMVSPEIDPAILAHAEEDGPCDDIPF